MDRDPRSQVFLLEFLVYVLKNSEDSYYIGQTSDLEMRLRRHNKGGVFWTKSRGPWAPHASKGIHTRVEAMVEERRLKRLKNRKALEAIVPRW
jgi:putative endonuclease